MDGRCRVCMAVATDVITDLATDRQFRFCTQLQAINVRLCQKCNRDLQVAYAFRLQALLADEVMRGTIPDTYVGDDAKVPASSTVVEIDTKPRQSDGDTKFSTPPGGPISLKCEFCSKSFTRRYILNNHRRLHTGEKPYSCAYCTSSFTSKLTLNRHSAQKHGSRASQGIMPYKNRDSMKMQRRLQASESIHKCGKCHKKFLSADGLHTHMAENHKASDGGEQVQPVPTESPTMSEDLSGGGGIGTSFPCEFCGKDFKRKSILMIHRRLHTGEKPFSCDQCDGTFITRDRLKLHKVRLHPSGLSLSENKACDICGKWFKRYDYLRVHSLSCGQSSPRAEQVIANKTNGSLNFQCEFCSKAFNRQRSLMIHRRLHTGEKPYTCDMCPLNFRTEESLNRHKVKVHIEDVCKDGVDVNVLSSDHQAPTDSGLRHQCEFCQKFFTRRAILERHRRLHTGERPYQCRDCDSAFISSDALRAHRVRNHSGEVTPLESSFLDMLSLTCEYCSKSFTRPANLKIHRRQHTGERPYSCSMCHCTFKILDSLNRHKVREHMRSDDGVTIKGDCIICCAGEVKCVAENASYCDMKETSRPLEFDNNQEDVEEQQGEAAESLELDINPGDFLVVSQIDSDSGLHVEPTNNETQQVHKCKTCGKLFAQVSSLQRHERSHTLKRPFTCEFCEKKFTRACVLNIHRRLHTGELPYECSQCSEAFRTKEGLQRHVAKQHKS